MSSIRGHRPSRPWQFLIAAALCAPAASPAYGQLTAQIPFAVTDSAPLPSGSVRGPSSLSFTVDLSPQGGGLLSTAPRSLLGLFSGSASTQGWQYDDPVLQDPNNPNSPVLQATLHAVLGGVLVGSTDGGFSVDNGAGESAGSYLAADFADRIEIATGLSKFVVGKDGTILKEGWSGNHQILTSGPQNGLYILDKNGVLHSSRWGTSTTTLQANGPAYARVSVTGLMCDVQGNVLTDYELLLEAFAGTPTLQASFEVTPGYWTTSDDLQVSQVHFIAQVAGGASPVLSAATSARLVLAATSATQGLMHGLVTSPNPPPWQSCTMNGGGGDLRGLSAVVRGAPSVSPLTVDPGGFVIVNVGFTKHFTLPNAAHREEAEFGLGLHDPVPADLNRHAVELLHALTAATL